MHRCIEQLSGPMPRNAEPILNGQPTAFVMPPRTAEEIKRDMAAEEGAVSRAPGRNKVVNETVPMEEMEERGELADPMAAMPPAEPPPAAKPKGWLL